MRNLFKKIIRFALPIAIIGVSYLGFKFLQVESEAVPPKIPEQRTWLVEVQQIKKETLAPVVELFGRVTTTSHSKLSSILDADVVEVNFSIGQPVQQGDVLIRLDSRAIETKVLQLQADVARINASLDRESQRLITDQELLNHEMRLQELASESLNRNRILKDRNIISQAEYDAAERAEQQSRQAVTARNAAIREHPSRMSVLNAELQRTKITLDDAKRDLEETVIIAPYSGRITNVHVAVGNHVRNGSPLIDLYNYADTEIRTLIPNRHLQQVRSAISNEMPLKAVAKFDGQLLELTLDRLAAIVDPGRGGIDGYFRLASKSYPELGRSITLALSLPPVENAIAIPFEAVYGSNQVFKVESESMKAVSLERHGQVKVGGRPFIVATSDQLQADELIVTTQLSNASDGLKIKPSNFN